jgi:hypothetical protein
MSDAAAPDDDDGTRDDTTRTDTAASAPTRETVDVADPEAVNAVLPGDADVDAILDDVEQVMHDLANLDVELDQPGDLELVRRELPTEPHRAELVAAALPAPLRNELEYVHPCDRQSGYWRRSRERSNLSALSDAELKHRLAFTESRIANRGVDGTTRTADGRRIARSVDRTGDELRGASFTDTDDGGELTEQDRERGRSLFSRVRDRLGL